MEVEKDIERYILVLFILFKILEVIQLNLKVSFIFVFFGI